MSKFPKIILNGIDVSLPPSSFTGGYVPTAAIEAARTYLGLFVTRQANLASERVGFGWTGQPGAPDTFDALSAAYDSSSETGEPLPISNEHCDNSIYPSAAANIALRFWHDSHHILRGRNFGTAHEIDMALWHLDVAADDGVRRDSVAWHLLEADMLGQTLCSAALGRFPLDQFVFDLNCVHFGIADAIVMEAELDFPMASGADGSSARLRLPSSLKDGHGG